MAGDHDVRVLSIHHGADTAGSNWGIAQAFRHHPQPGITVHSTVRTRNWIDYPADIRWSDAARYWQLADVVHLHNNAKSLRLFEPRRPHVLHYHGTQYRTHAAAYNDYTATTPDVVPVVSTHDLLAFGPDLTWIPQAHDLDWLATHRDPRPGTRLRVAHAPTSRAVKDTEAFLDACHKVDVEPVLIERAPWADCLTLKGQVDVYYDQVQLGYGGNAIESWAMGIPVIAGADQDTMYRMQADFGGALPFMPASVATLADRLAEMRDDAARAAYADRGAKHVRTWHDGRVTAERLAGIYRGLTDPRPED